MARDGTVENPGSRAFRSGRAWFERKSVPFKLSIIYLVGGMAWIHLEHYILPGSWVLKDSLFIISSAFLLYWLVSHGMRKIRRADEALWESRERLGLILETNPCGIILVDRHGALGYANPAAADLLGMPRGDLVGKRYDEMGWEEELPGSRVLRLGETVSDVECAVTRPDGARLYLSVNAAPLHDAAGGAAGMVAAFFDITERKKAQDLRLRKLSLALEQSPVATMITDVKSRIEYVNPKYVQMTGYTLEEVAGTNATTLCERSPSKCAEVCAALCTLGEWKEDCQGRTKNGNLYMESVRVSPLRDMEGTITHYVWIREDVTERMRAYESLRESRAQFRNLVETINDWVWETDADGEYRYVSPKVRDLLGYEPEEVLGRTLFDLMPSFEAERVGATLRPLIRDRQPFAGVESVTRHEKGHYVILETSGVPFFDPEGTFRGYRGVGRDVSERKRVEEELRRSEARFREASYTLEGIIRTSPLSIILLDREGKVTMWNPAAERTFGWSEREVLGSLLPTVPENGKEEFARIFENASRGTGSSNLEVKRRRKDGSVIDALLSTAPQRDAAGNVIGAIGILADITDRKLAEAALRESEERFRQLFEQNEEPILIMRAGTCEILDANAAAETLYGCTRDELIARGLSLFVEPRDYEAFAREVEGIDEGKNVRIERTMHVRSDGTRIIVSLYGKSIRLREGSVLYCTIRDITERVRMEEESRLQHAQLIHANRMASLGTIVSGVAHEVNNPNNLIMFNAPMVMGAWESASPLLEEYYEKNGDFSLGGLSYSEMREVVPKLLQGISDASLRIKNIVGSLKDFVRQERGRPDSRVDVNDVIKTAIGILNHAIIRGTHNFTVEYGPGLPLVMGSAQQLEQVAINLLTNSLQALPDPWCGIVVSSLVDPETGRVEIRVRDEGNGMPKEIMERVTEPFFSTRHDAGGLGLGLSISLAIVKFHKGTLRFESEAGVGTTAIVSLPPAGGPA